MLAPVDPQKMIKFVTAPPLQVVNLLGKEITIARQIGNEKAKKSKLWFLVFIFSLFSV